MHLAKHLIALGLALGGTSLCVSSQTASHINTPVTLDAGAILAKHYPVGDMWWDPARDLLTGIEFPKGDTLPISGYNAVILGGFDEQQQLRVAGSYYRVPASDYKPGPIVNGDSASQAAMATNWSHIWKVSSASIDAFLASFASGVPTIPQDVLEWPAKGNILARGANGATLTLDRDFAPFVDANQDGIYNPYYGDYPKIKGSQMLWWLFNDQTAHPLTRTLPVNAEIAVSAYAYTAGTAVDSILFYEYEVLNRGGALSRFHFATYSDIDIAFPYNDLLGRDSSRRLGVFYNGKYEDDTSNSVAAGIIMLDQPGDTYRNRIPARNVTERPFTEPSTGQAFYQRISSPQPNIETWTLDLDLECDNITQPGNRTLVISSQPVTLASNERVRYAYALVLADRAGFCPRVNLDGALRVADTAYERYWHPSRLTPPSNPTSVSGSLPGRLVVYPNPAQHTLYINAPVSGATGFRLTNTLGAAVPAPARASGSGYELDLSGLPAGVYFLQLRSAAGMSSCSFIHR